MPRNIIKSNNAVIAVSTGTEAFSTNTADMNLFNAVQNTSFSIAVEHQPSKQIGTQDFGLNDVFIQPDVELTFSYYPEPKLENEVHGNFIKTVDGYNGFIRAFSGTLENNTNFYLLNNPDQERDILDFINLNSTETNLNGFESASFGNCFLTSYGLTYGVDSLPTVTTSYVCSNMKFEALTGTSMVAPSINLESGNNNNVGRARFAFVTGTKDPVLVNPKNPESTITLQNLQAGGQILSGTHFVQSLDMSVSLQRVSSYGLGSDYAYNRKAQLPAQGVFNVNSLVSGYDDGTISGILGNETDYTFDLVLDGSGKDMTYSIDGAKLENYSYSLPVNGIMTFNASFTFEVTEKKGLRLSGTYYT